MAITKEQARAELARRELAKRGISSGGDESAVIPQTILGLLGLGGGYLGYRAMKPIIKSAGYITRGIKNVPKVTSTEKGAAFAEQKQLEFAQAHTNKITEFGKDLDKWSAKYPDRGVDLSGFIKELQTNPEISKEAINIFQKTPVLGDLINNPEMASNVPLKETQNIINFINQKVPPAIRQRNFDVLDGLNTIKGEQILAFPEMGQTRAAYKEFIVPYNNVKNNFRFNRTLPAITSEGAPFGGAQGWEAVKKILPKESINQIRNYRAGERIARIPRKTPWLGRYLGIAPNILQSYGMAQNLQEAQQRGGLHQMDISGELTPVAPSIPPRLLEMIRKYGEIRDPNKIHLEDLIT